MRWAVLGVLASLMIGATQGWAGEYRFSFPAAYCEAAPKITGVTAVGVDVGAANPNAPDKFGWSFAPTTGVDRVISCDVLFPASVSSANFIVNLTWQSSDSAPSSPPQVCWGAQWEVTMAGQSWAANTGGNAALTVSPAPVTTSANVDIHTPVQLTAVNAGQTPCAAGTAPGICAGSHGELIIHRANSGACPNESLQAGVLTRIELVGATP